jgi:hypothetical protein
MDNTNGTSTSRGVDLDGAIAAFDRLSRHALAYDEQSFVGLFLAESSRLLQEIEAGRTVDEHEWLESLEAARLVSQMDGGPPHA